MISASFFSSSSSQSLARDDIAGPHPFRLCEGRDHELATTLSSSWSLLKVAQRAFSGDGLHPPHARRHAAFFQNLDQSDLAGRRRVRAAAEFGREVADLDDADFVAILLAEQRHGVILVDGHVNRHVLDDLDLFVAQDFFVDDVFDVLQLFVFDAGEVRKVKAQMIGRDQRPGLLHMLAQHFSQSGMKKVRRGVIAHGG